MPKVIVTTDSGTTVAEFDIDAHAGRMLPAGVPMNVQANQVLVGVRRAIRDADCIERGIDPERLSEKAMRMMAEANEG